MPIRSVHATRPALTEIGTTDLAAKVRVRWHLTLWFGCESSCVLFARGAAGVALGRCARLVASLRSPRGVRKKSKSTQRVPTLETTKPQVSVLLPT